MRLPAALMPLEGPVFRSLWLAWLGANMTMWMNDVAAAWLMTTLTDSAVMVALVQSASTLPMFLLGLPSGALADITDRRLYLASTQLWVAAVSLLTASLAFADALSAKLLLALTFLNGIGLAMRWPVFAAIVPEVVTKAQLPAALALNGISMNLSRILGPTVAGALLAGAGAAWVFILNAVVAVGALVVILRWRSVKRPTTLPGERFLGAIRIGLQHVRESPRMRAVTLRVFLFSLQMSALVALMPLVARRLSGAGPGMFTVLLATMGSGAIAAALLLPRWRARLDRDQMVFWGSLTHAAASATVALAPAPWIALPSIFLVGMAWISTANTLSTSAQLALPDWVRARGMAVYQMALMGGTALGAMLFGNVAARFGVQAAIVSAAAAGAVLLPIVRNWSVGGKDVNLDRVPTHDLLEPVTAIHLDEGPVMVTVEYQIDPAQAAEFIEVMQLTRAARLRRGALSWGLFRDTAIRGCYLEYFLHENWLEHQRRLERFTAADAELRERRLAFHIGEQPPLRKRYVGSQRLHL
ncbi:Enterobactin exporter EntS [Cupriavidus yeoncheonensis]|uniref:Enterobactin exporter EntS n=1 Tax=Cupriavidus yeoncheonensis TaxID=1462994 RepID=A0A916IY19_9BURK|nr:MFS transporter [Cupriavidus yeoncheonensis]CAG2153623.1 Enterobactin exporter EntS [Cupriavidus yeoncheonensis]